jgi:lysophospholipase L1-like esterase
LKQEAKNRSFTVVDIFPLSQTLTGEQWYIADGLHPNADGYKKWTEVITPALYEILK